MARGVCPDESGALVRTIADYRGPTDYQVPLGLTYFGAQAPLGRLIWNVGSMGFFEGSELWTAVLEVVDHLATMATGRGCGAWALLTSLGSLG